MKSGFKIFCCIFFISIISTGCFHETKRPNIFESFYINGVLESKKYFWKDGVFVDTAYYYRNGQPKLIEVRNDSGILNGKVIFFNHIRLSGIVPVIKIIVNGTDGDRQTIVHTRSIISGSHGCPPLTFSLFTVTTKNPRLTVSVCTGLTKNLSWSARVTEVIINGTDGDRQTMKMGK